MNPAEQTDVAVPLTPALSPRRGSTAGGDCLRLRFRGAMRALVRGSLSPTLSSRGGEGGVAATRVGSEIAEGLENVESAELQRRVIDLGGVKIAHEVSGGLLPRAGLSKEGLLGKPNLMLPFFPLGEVVGL